MKYNNFKGKNIKILTFLVMMIALSTLGNISFNKNNGDINNYLEIQNPNNVKTSGYWNNFTYIYINGNWSTVASYDWCSGDGSWDNPYTIENITMDGSLVVREGQILIENSKNDYFIIRNCTVFNVAGESGIKLINSNNGTIEDCDVSNAMYGIHLNLDSDNNTISRNTINDNTVYGIWLQEDCNNNTITQNEASNTKTTAQDRGIYCYDNCDNNTIIGNTAIKNSEVGIGLWEDCDRNNVSENYVYLNPQAQVKIYTSSAASDFNNIQKNVLVSEDDNFIQDGAPNTIITTDNLYLTSAPSLCVDDLVLFFSETEFVFTINISSNFNIFKEYDFSFTINSLQMWWNGTAVQTDNITEIGTGSYNISLTPILVTPGEDPVLFNISISATKHGEFYYELDLAVDPETVGSNKTVENEPPDDESGPGDTSPSPPPTEPPAIPGYDLLLIVISLIGSIAIGLIYISKQKRF